MKKNNIIILSLFIFLTLGIVLFNYANQLTSLIAEAVAPNPGHSLSEIEGGSDLATKAYVDSAVAPIRIAGTKNDAGLIASGSGFFQANAPLNYYSGASNWQHLIESRHTNDNNNYALQIAGSFFDQNLYFRKINNNPETPWSKIATEDYVDNHTMLFTGCDVGDAVYFNGSGLSCDSPLTWAGTTKTQFDCYHIGGTIYDTGATGTICKYPGSTVPTGWTQAASWQRYSGPASFGGDSCGKNKSSRPATFANQDRIVKRAGAQTSDGWRQDCGSANEWGIVCPTNNKIWKLYKVITEVSNIPTGRVEIGIY